MKTDEKVVRTIEEEDRTIVVTQDKEGNEKRHIRFKAEPGNFQFKINKG